MTPLGHTTVLETILQDFLFWHIRWVLGCNLLVDLADFPMNNPPWRGYEPYRPRQQQRPSVLANLLPIVRALSTSDLFDLLREIVLEVQFRLATLQANQARTPPHSPPRLQAQVLSNKATSHHNPTLRADGAAGGRTYISST